GLRGRPGWRPPPPSSAPATLTHPGCGPCSSWPPPPQPPPSPPRWRLTGRRAANADSRSPEYMGKIRRPGARGRRREASEAAVREFGRLFWRHGPAVHAYLSRRAGHQHADDLLEEVWVRAFRSRDRYDDRLPALAWLYGIARNVLLGHFRSRHPIAAA